MSRHLTWNIHATSPTRMQGRRGEAGWTTCESRITPQTGWNRRAEGRGRHAVCFPLHLRDHLAHLGPQRGHHATRLQGRPDAGLVGHDRLCLPAGRRAVVAVSAGPLEGYPHDLMACAGRWPGLPAAAGCAGKGDQGDIWDVGERVEPQRAQKTQNWAKRAFWSGKLGKNGEKCGSS